MDYKDEPLNDIIYQIKFLFNFIFKMLEKFIEYYKQIISEEKSEVSEEEKKEQELKEKSLTLTFKESMAGSAAGAVADTYVSPFLIAIGATLSQIAAFTSITNLIAPLAQLFTTKLIEKKGRKKVVLQLALSQTLIWLPIIASIFLYLHGFRFTPTLIIILWTVYSFLGNLAAPASNSWMGDLVPEEKRGRYFALLNSVASIVSLIGVICASLILDFGKKKSILFYCFISLFFVGMLLRLFSLKYTKKKYEPKLALEEGYYFSLWSFIKTMRKNNFGRFVIYRSLFALANNIAEPFFAVFVLRELGFSYLQYTIALIIVPSFIQIVLFPLWGIFSDKYGNLETLKIAGLLASLYPFLWIISQNFYYIIFVPMILSGMGWSGINLATANFIFDNTTSKKRSLCFAYFSVFLGCGVFVGANLGGFLAKLPINFINNFLLLFLISGTLKLITIYLMPKRVKEVRRVQKRGSFYQNFSRYLQLFFRPFFGKRE